MKRVILFLGFAIAMVCSMSAQSSDLKKWVNKTKNGGNDIYQVEKNNASKQSTEASILMEKSIKLQYGAVACAGVGTGLAIVGAIIGTKDYEDVPVEDRLDKVNSDRKLRKSLFIGSGVSFAVALCLELASIERKLKAGRSVKFFANGSGGGMAYTF